MKHQQMEKRCKNTKQKCVWGDVNVTEPKWEALHWSGEHLWKRKKCTAMCAVITRFILYSSTCLLLVVHFLLVTFTAFVYFYPTFVVFSVHLERYFYLVVFPLNAVHLTFQGHHRYSVLNPWVGYVCCLLYPVFRFLQFFLPHNLCLRSYTTN